jgi:hypothetical protein
MWPAAELQIPGSRLPSFRERGDVVKLQETARGASSAGADECAATLISRPHLAPDGRRHVTRSGLMRPLALRTIRASELLLFQIHEEQRERASEDDGWISVGDGMPQQILDAAQHVVSLPVDRELHLEPLWCKRHERRPVSARGPRSC